MTFFFTLPTEALENLNGKCSEKAVMTYGLSYMITDILNTLITRTDFLLSFLLARTYSADGKGQPRVFLMSPIIGACFPFKKDIASLFTNSKHIIMYKL